MKLDLSSISFALHVSLLSLLKHPEPHSETKLIFTLSCVGFGYTLTFVISASLADGIEDVC